MEKELKYKLQPVHLNADSPEELDFPNLRDRIIEKRGDVYTFSLSEIDENTAKMLQSKKELSAKRDYEKAVMENIEHFHPKLIKKLSDEDLLTAWMYKQSKGHVEMCEKNIEKIDKQLEEDRLEVEEIMRQIPELKMVKSADIIDDEVVLVDNE